LKQEQLLLENTFKMEEIVENMHKAFEEINDINKSVDLETVDCYLN